MSSILIVFVLFLLSKQFKGIRGVGGKLQDFSLCWSVEEEGLVWLAKLANDITQTG